MVASKTQRNSWWQNWCFLSFQGAKWVNSPQHFCLPGNMPSLVEVGNCISSWSSRRSFLVCVLSHFSRVWHFATLWIVACQAPLSMGFSRQEYWSGLPCPPPGALPHSGIEPRILCLLHWQAGSLPLAPPGKPQAEYIPQQTKFLVQWWNPSLSSLNYAI